jgi:hypothetical protein
VTIAGLEVEVTDLKNAADLVMDMVESQVAGEEPKPAIDRRMCAPQKLVVLLRVTSLTTAMESLVRVKSHFPEVDMVKVGEGLDVSKDLKAVEPEVNLLLRR